jgi:hypothetical protein
LSQTCEDILDEFSINVFVFLEGTPTKEMVNIDEHIYPCAFNKHDFGKYYMGHISIIEFLKNVV